MKKLLIFLLSLALLLSAAACGTHKAGEPPEFKAVSEQTADCAEITVSGDRAVLSFIRSSLDSSEASLVLYDLATDKLLGTLENADGEDDVFFTDSGLLLLSHKNKSLTEYDFSFKKKSVRSFDGIKGEIALSGMSDGKLLLSSSEDGKSYIFDTLTNDLTESEYTASGARFLSPNKDGFLVSSDEGLSLVRFDGKAKELTYLYPPSIAGTAYALSKTGDYLVFHSVSQKKLTMTLASDVSELLGASGGRFFGRAENTLYLYDTDRSVRYKNELDGRPLAAAVWGDYTLVITEKDGLASVLALSASGDGERFELTDYHKPTIDGVTPLPAPDGEASLAAEIKKIENDFGVRVMYEDGFFDFSEASYTVTAATEDAVKNRLPLIREMLSRFPSGIFYEAAKQAPLVIYLCDTLDPSANGINTQLRGYNVSAVTVGGKDAFFLNTLAHELWHALEQNARAKTLESWDFVMPSEVAAAYENHALTVEYTLDDRGKTPVWFASVYGRMSAVEDRATIFAEMLSGNKKLFSHTGIKRKAKCLEEILQSTYDCCRDATFSWNDIYKN